MPQWFVPPIVIPAGLAALIVAIVLYRYFVGAWNQSAPNCLPSSRSKKVAQTEWAFEPPAKSSNSAIPSRSKGLAEFARGNYEVVTDAELIEGLSFPVYRRVATMMLAPTQSSQALSIGDLVKSITGDQRFTIDQLRH
jgi:hypothetical protein